MPPRSANAAHELPEPADAVGIETVGWFVQDQDCGVTEQCTCESEPLAHPEREPFDTAMPGVGEIDFFEHGVDPLRRQIGGGGQDAKVVSCPSTGMEGVGFEHRADAAKRLVKIGVSVAVDRGAARRTV